MTPPEAEGMRQIAGTPAQPSAVSVVSPEVATSLHSSAMAPAPEAGPVSATSPKRRKGVLVVIPKRADFLRAASAKRQGTGSFLLQARDRRDSDPVTRIGFTASKKIGNSVMRNRARRRMREVARAILPVMGRAGWDYVLVARPAATVSRDFTDLLADLRTAFEQVHRERAPSDAPRERAKPREGRSEAPK